MKLKPSVHKIFQQDWLSMHPYSKPVSSDSYYVGLSNKILSALSSYGYKDLFSPSNLKDISLCVTAYFEDVISGFGLWRAFTGMHFRLYGKLLPFYEVDDEYMEDEMNEQDVRFLVWNIVQIDVFEQSCCIVNPDNPAIGLLALHIYGILEEEYESAPENEFLQSLFISPELYADFYEFRNCAGWLFYDSYLMRPSTRQLLERSLKQLDESGSKFDFINKRLLMYTLEVDLIFNSPCGPLGLNIHEWMAAIAGRETEIGQLLLNIKKRSIKNSYLVIGEYEDSIGLLSLNGEELLLSRCSYERGVGFRPQEDVLTAGLVYFKDYWYVNGFLTISDTERYRSVAEKEEKRMHGNRMSYARFMEANKGRPVAYLKDAAQLRLYMHKIFQPEDESLFDADKIEVEGWENLVVYADPEEGLFIYPHLAVWLKSEDNPYYDNKQAVDGGFGLLTGEYAVSWGLVEYITRNGLMPDLGLKSLKGAEYGRMQVQNNMGFLFGFFRSRFQINADPN